MKKYFVLPLLSGWLLSGCSFSMAGDVKPPAGYQSEPVAAQVGVTPSSIYPLVPPDPITGQEVYVKNCAPCHGNDGLGDGPRARFLPDPVPAIGSQEVTRNASPVTWFNYITRGNLKASMPSFNSLTSRQRWDVLAYVFILSDDQSMISEGQKVYQEQCQRCHGETGRGDGSDATDLQTPDFTQLQYMASRSSADLFTSISSGKPPEMPAFAGRLTDGERWAVASYIRTFGIARPSSYASGSAPYPGLPYPSYDSQVLTPFESGGITSIMGYPDPTTNPETPDPLTSIGVVGRNPGIISGIVTNGSGGVVPAGSVVTLHGFDEMQLVLTTTTQIQPDGNYSFDQVALAPNQSFFTSVEFENVTYVSDLETVQTEESSINLPIEIFDTTTDVDVLTADRAHYFFQLSDPRLIQVVELYIISNNSSKTLIASAAQVPVFTVPLPSEAVDLRFQDGLIGNKYLKTDNGFGVMTPIQPGQGVFQLLFSYQLPYDRKLDLIRTSPFDLHAFVVLASENDLTIQGTGLQDDGTREVEGNLFHMYSGSKINKGQNLNLTITDRTKTAVTGLRLLSNNNFVFGLTVLGFVLIAVGVWLFMHRHSNPLEKSAEKPASMNDYESPQAIMDAILALDDLYQEGLLPEEAYLQRRGELKALLRDFITKHD